MIFLEIKPNKLLKKLKDEDTFITENLISSFHIKLPSTFGDYKTSDLECEMRVYLPTGDYMAYDVPTSSSCQEVPITNDITGAVQTVKIMFIFSKDGNVIGKTNSIEKQILDAPIKGDPLTPREEFDEVIREQRETISEQAETITTQGQTITQQGEQITELNGEVTELTNENGELKTQHTADQNTIQYLIDNPPEAHLQPKSVEPTNQMQVVEPDEGYQGLSTVTVGATTPPRLQGKAVTPTNLMQNVQPDSGYDGLSNVAVAAVTAQELGFDYSTLKKDVEFLGGVGTYDPFPYNSVGGIYIIKADEDGYPVKFLVKNYERTQNPFPQFFDKSTAAVRALEEIVFENCPNITDFGQLFRDLTYLKKATLPENLTTIANYAFLNCQSLVIINFPKSLTSIGTMQAFFNCHSLEYVTIENGFNCNNLNLSNSTLYSHDTILSWFNALADRTGETAYTLTIGTTNLNKMTAEEKAIATNKNWNLA